MTAIKYNPPMDIGNIFTGVKNYIWETGKQYDWIYRLELIKANSDYSEFYWMLPWGDVEYLGATLEEAVKKLDEIHDAENAADEERQRENNLKIHGVEELPDNVYTLDDVPF